MEAPATIYCLKCRSHQPVVAGSCKMGKVEFKSKKDKDMWRNTWTAQCSVCSKDMRRYAKTIKEVAAEVPQVSQVPQVPQVPQEVVGAPAVPLC